MIIVRIYELEEKAAVAQITLKGVLFLAVMHFLSRTDILPFVNEKWIPEIIERGVLLWTAVTVLHQIDHLRYVLCACGLAVVNAILAVCCALRSQHAKKHTHCHLTPCCNVPTSLL